MGKVIRFVTILLFIGTSSNADPSKAKVIETKNSDCRIESSAGEYPMFKIYKGKKVIYSPSSDGIVNGAISPDGKYAALAGGEIALIEGFGVMIINCSSGRKVGFLSGKPTYIKKWENNKLILGEEELSFAGKNASQLPQ